MSKIVLDTALRPDTWNDYIGQDLIKRNVAVLLQAAKERKEPVEHLLFYGPAGLGKTTLAHLIAHELGSQMRVTSGPALEHVGDFAAILTNLTDGDILFIDEAHRLNKTIEEVLYPAMESGVLHIVIGKGPSARSIELTLPRFTLIAATTRVASLSNPLRSRFSGGTYRLEYYNNDEIVSIIKRSANILGVTIDSDAALEIARRSRHTPRTANHLLKRVRDYAQVGLSPNDTGKHRGSNILTKDTVRGAIDMMKIDKKGLSVNDRRILETIIKKFNGGPIGLSTLAAATSEEEATIEEVVEPYLLRLGLIERTPRGRIATQHAYKHLGLNNKPG